MTAAANRLIKSIVILLVCGRHFCQENPAIPGPINNEGATGGMAMTGTGAGLLSGINPYLSGENEQPAPSPYMQQGPGFAMTPRMLGIFGARDGINPFSPGMNEQTSGNWMLNNAGQTSPNIGSGSTFGRSPNQYSMFSNLLKGVPKANTLIFYRILNPEFAAENVMLSRLFCMRCLTDNNMICISMYCSPE